MLYKLCSSKTAFIIILLFLIYENVLGNVAHLRSNASSESLTEDLQDEDELSTLQDTFPDYIISEMFFYNTVTKKMYKSAGYPYKEIASVVNVTKKYLMFPFARSSGTVSYSGVPVIPRTGPFPLEPMAGGPRRTTPACKEILQVLYPIKGKGVDGKMYYIVNVKGFMQRTDIAICHKSGANCADKSVTPENYTYRCKQRHEDVRLSTFPVGENITTATQSVNTFKIPNGCVCERIRTYDFS